VNDLANDGWILGLLDGLVVGLSLGALLDEADGILDGALLVEC